MIKAQTAIIDGEIVALDRTDKPSFDALRRSQRKGAFRTVSLIDPCCCFCLWCRAFTMLCTFMLSTPIDHYGHGGKDDDAEANRNVGLK